MNSKTKKYEFLGLNKDFNPEKHPDQYLFDAKNMRFLSTTEAITGAIAFEKGNEKVLELPNITIDRASSKITWTNSTDSGTISYTSGGELDTDVSLPLTSTTQKIIGQTSSRNQIILFTTDDLGMDCIWTVNNNNFALELKYVRNLEFSINNPIQAIFNYENENIQKIYWVDGKNQIRFLNLTHESIEDNGLLIDIPANSINFVGVINFSQPVVTAVNGGGNHTAGKIQYAYNLYRLHSSQTKISPLSELVPLGKGLNLGGGDVNENVGAAPVIHIDNIDSSYTHINVYAIKYTSFNQVPSVNLIEERELNGHSDITVYDDGSSIRSLSLEEFLFLGSDPYIAKHIEAKDNSLFLFNVQDELFTLPKELDTRAYSFPINSTTTTIYDNVGSTLPSGQAMPVTNNYNIPLAHDSINLDYDTNKYKYNSTVLGGTGKFITYELNTNPTLAEPENNYEFFKDREIYRIGIQFYNRLGQISLPKWIADFKSHSKNLLGEYGTLKVELTPAFGIWLSNYAWEDENAKPVGYKIIRADRTTNDRTILCQGILNGMMVNSPRPREGGSSMNLYTYAEKKTDSLTKRKLPNFLVRTFREISPLKRHGHLKAMQFGDPSGTRNKFTEIQYSEHERKADTYQYNVMMQIYSPEIMFDNLPLSPSLKLNVLGGVLNTDNSYWGQERRIDNQSINVEGKSLGKLTPHAAGGTNININGWSGDLMDRGLISNTEGDLDKDDSDELVEFNQWYREFGEFIPANQIREYPIYGAPELTRRGQSSVLYNNNSKYEYTNTLEGFLTDGNDQFDEDGDVDRAVISLNSYGADCITMVLDDGSQVDADPHTRTRILQLYNNTGMGNTNTILLTELVKPADAAYLTNIYGGNSYEDKKRTTYIEIGEYKQINETSIQINSPGDTFVDTFKFMRIGKTDTEIYSAGVNQISELVSVKLETSVDLKHRNDSSISVWDSNFQPRYNEYHNYNLVYSQQPTLIQNTDVDFNFRPVRHFDTRIQATKTKIPNEVIDSWSDVLSNEVLDLDGRYGPINAVTSFRDKIYTFQDNAFAIIGINPRVQTQGNDGVSIELGSGRKLFDYNYISTTTGAINKWGVISSERAIYFIDGLNKKFQRFTNQLEPLSELKGLHSHFQSNLNLNALRADNPLLNTGISMGYDQKNNDVYITYNNTWTLAFNEMLNEFSSFYDYNSPIYIWNKENFFSINPNNTKEIWEFHKGNYNEFYGENKESYITIIANPEPDHESIFTNLEWKSIAKPKLSTNKIDTDILYTWENVRIWNEFQNSGLVPIEKIRRLNRKWRLALPRDANKTKRIRNTWAYIKLSSNNLEGHYYTNQGIILYYIPNYIAIQ